MTEHGNVCWSWAWGPRLAANGHKGAFLVWGNGNVSEMFLSWIAVMTAEPYKCTENR